MKGYVFGKTLDMIKMIYKQSLGQKYETQFCFL